MVKKILFIIEGLSFIGIGIVPIIWLGSLFSQKSMANTDFTSGMSGGSLFFTSVFLFFAELLCITVFFFICMYRKRREERTIIRLILQKIKIRYIVGVVVFLLILAFFCIIHLGQNFLLYHPNYSDGGEYYLGQREAFEKVEVHGEDNTYIGWIHKASRDSRKTIVYFGGNAESSAATLCEYDIEGLWETFSNFNFLMVDYPGYGLSEGETTKENLLNMARETLKFVKEEESMNQEIVVMGYSLGTGVAAYAASEIQIDKLILLAPYDRMENVYNEYVNIFYGPLRYLVRNDYDSIACAEKIKMTPLIVASKTDKVIPYELSVNLGKCFSNGVEFVTLENVEHGEFMYQKEVKDEIHDFLEGGK